MEDAVKRLEEIKKGFQAFAEASPQVIGAFGQMREAACNKSGALDLKTKELISIAVAVALKCEPCILSHLEVIVDLGISREELAEALNATILLCGGPGWAYSAFALQVYDQFASL